jgi:photosystem II stability/assembly factor-like uncharacterized protein
LNQGLAITEFNQGAVGSMGSMLAGTQAEGTLSYADGQGWEALERGDGGFSVIDPRDPNTIYVTVSPGTIQASGVVEKSTDGGATFSVVFPPPGQTYPGQFIAPLVMDPRDPDTLYFGQNQLFESTDAGATWRAISPVLGPCPPVGVPTGCITSIAPAPSDPETIYLGMHTGEVLVTRDGGHSGWVNTGLNGLAGKYVTSIVVNPSDSEQAFAGEASWGMPHLFRTDDAGGLWSSVVGVSPSSLPDAPVDAIVVDWSATPRTMYVGTDVGAFYSTDQGSSWSPLGTGMPNTPVMDLLMDRGAGKLIALTHGRGAFWLSLP